MYLQQNIEKVHTTPMGLKRISRNLAIKQEEVVLWCKKALQEAELMMEVGKNWYAIYKGVSITINANSFTIITAHKMRGTVREMVKTDYPCLHELLYQAIYVPKGQPLPPRELINNPDISIYIKDFGEKVGDVGVVAIQNGQVVGAAWVRLISAYGYVGDDIPELVISLLPEFRGCGMGAKLMRKLFALLKKKGVQKTSLSVQKNNPAVRFYERLGYKIIKESIKEDQIMVKEL